MCVQYCLLIGCHGGLSTYNSNFKLKFEYCDDQFKNKY